ncbi:MAG: hypothetical protein JWO69_2058 [Thermoleophilia bacterium]|nr:hypothetical protein [Thermoleophilia bacterium]
MTDDDDENDGVLLARIVIEMRMTDEEGDGMGQPVYFEATDGAGEALPLIQTLGLLRLCEDTAIRVRMSEDPEEDE